MKPFFTLCCVTFVVLLVQGFVVFPAQAKVTDGTSEEEIGSGFTLDTPGEEIPKGPQSGREVIDLVLNITNWIFILFLLAAVVLIVLAGFRFITGGGDPTAISGARTGLFWGIGGIVLAIAAKGIPVVIASILGGTGGFPESLPPGNSPPVVSAIQTEPSDIDSLRPGAQFLEGTTVTYSATASDEDTDDVLTWEWFYVFEGVESSYLKGSGDGNINSGEFTYGLGEKIYDWIIRVKDGQATTEKTLRVEIVAPEPLPVTCSDIDEDGYGDPGDASCRNGAARDCDDRDPSLSPGSGVVCNYNASCTVPADDSACGAIDCNSLDTACKNYNNITSNRCEGYADCKDANIAVCTSFTNASPGVSCGGGNLCDGGGNCLSPPPDKICGDTSRVRHLQLILSCDTYCGMFSGSVTCTDEEKLPRDNFSTKSLDWNNCSRGDFSDGPPNDGCNLHVGSAICSCN